VSEQSGIKAGDEGFQVTVKGNTDLKGAVIASTEAAAQGQKNSLTTGSLTTSDLENHATYSGSSVSLSGGYSRNSDLGKDNKGTASATPVPGTTLPSLGGWSAAPPIAMSASGDAASTTKSGISGGAIAITNEAQQQTLTGKDGATTVASLNREVSSDKDGSNKLKPIFNKEEIQADFQIVGAFANQVGTFLANRAQETDKAKGDLDKELSKPESERDLAKIDQLTNTILDNATWNAGGAGRVILTVLTGAASGNVTGSTGEMLQSAAVGYLQSLGAQEAKALADSLKDENGEPTKASEAVRGALQALAACGGAQAQGSNCGSGALAAAGSVVLTNLFNDGSSLTEAQKQGKEALISTIVTGIVQAAGGDATVAATASQIELANNGLTTDFIAAAKKVASKAANGVSKLMDKITIQRLVDSKEAIRDYLNEKAAHGGLSDADVIFLATLYAANETLFPETILDIPGVGRLIGLTGKLIKANVAAEKAAKLAKIQVAAEESRGARGAGAALVDTKAVLTQQVADLRATLTGKAKTGGNMAVAQIDIPGVQTTMAASSRIEPTAAQQSLGFVGEVPETFQSSTVLTADGRALPRSGDSEAKILNNVAAQLGKNTSASGTINLLTERPPCASCSNIIQQFQAKYPKIKINVMDNGGANIPPTRKGP